MGLFVGFSRVWCCAVVLVIGFVLYCMQTVILAFSTIVAHLPHFPVIPIAKTLKIMSFKLELGEIPPYFELAHHLEQTLGQI